MSEVTHEPLWPNAPANHGMELRRDPTGKPRHALNKDGDQINAAPTPRGYDPVEILDSAKAIIAERGVGYGGIEQSFDRAAQIASLKLNKPITARDVCVILESVKDARLAVNYGHEDSLVDRINYAAFRAAFELKGASK